MTKHQAVPDWFYEKHKTVCFWAYESDADNALAELDALEAGIISENWSEREVLNYLRGRSNLLSGSYRDGHGTFVFREATLGPYQADYLVASGHSGGLDWELIELECPQKIPFISDGGFSESTRKGFNQILEWRRWLERQIASVQGSSHDQLGYFGLSNRAAGIVVVGNREKYEVCDSNRLARFYERREEAKHENGIEVISYQTWIGRMRNGFRKSNKSAVPRHAVPPTMARPPCGDVIDAKTDVKDAGSAQ